MFGPSAFRTILTGFGREAHVVTRGLGPGRVGEGVFASEFFLKEVDVEDQGQFGFVVSGVNFFEGEGIGFAEDCT